MRYDLIIIGGGPAACAAAVYAGRKRMKTLLITESFGGQSMISDSIENWIGEQHIGGAGLAKKLEDHARAQDMVAIKSSEIVLQVRPLDQTALFEVTTNKNATYLSRTVIVASGSRRRKLNVPGEKEFEGRGVAYCSTCDAPLFRGRDVAVVGGGNASLEAVIDLIPYAGKIYLLNIGDALTGDEITQKEVQKHGDRVIVIHQAVVTEVLGSTTVTGLKYKKDGKVQELSLGGVFVEIGAVPNSEIVKNVVKLNAYGEIVIDH